MAAADNSSPIVTIEMINGTNLYSISEIGFLNHDTFNVNKHIFEIQMNFINPLKQI